MTYKIPKNAKIAFKGKIFKIYQWEQKQFDGTYKTFEVVYRNPSVQIFAITKDKKIIVLNEEQPNVGKFISLPGGVVDDNEDPLDSAKRELKEECGAISKEIRLYKKTNFNSKIIWKTYYYIAKNCEFVTKQTLDPGEKIEISLVSFEDFIKISQNENFRNKEISNIMFKIIHTKKELEKLKQLLLG
jgi:ADP-ribose pyrophosphatase